MSAHKSPVQCEKQLGIEFCRSGKRHRSKPSWSEENPEGRWRSFDYEGLAKRDKINLDIFWLKDESLEDAENLPEPEVLAAEIVEDLQAALEAFEAIQAELETTGD